MNTYKRSFIITFLLLICIAVSFITGYLTHQYLSESNNKFPILNEAYRILSDQALNPLPNPPALEYGMIRGMVQAYGDPFTVFLDPPQHELETDSLRGSFGGIGVTLLQDAEGNIILNPFPDGPAFFAGIQEGDRLIAVDDLTITSLVSMEQIQSAVRGPVGSKVKITIGRAPDYTPLQFTIKRAEISIPSVTWHIEPTEPRLGVIEVNIIAESTMEELKKALIDLQTRSATHFVLDLRNNGGGLLKAGIDISRLFLSDGEVIQQQYRGKDMESFRIEKTGEFATIPMVILVNQNTASAAEIIAGSIQAHKRAKLVGYPTFGKNTIQLVYTLQDESSMHVTAAKWWIPGWEFPRNDHGLEPDIPLDENASEQQVLQTVIQELFK